MFAALLSCASMQPRIHYNGLEWVFADYKRAHARTYSHIHIHTHIRLFSFDAAVPDIGPGGARVLSGWVEFNYVKFLRFNSSWEYFSIFAFPVWWVCCATFLNLPWQCRSSEAPVLNHRVETDPLGVQRKVCWSIAGVEAKLSPPWGSRQHL